MTVEHIRYRPSRNCRGLARALLDAAIGQVETRGGRWIALQVDADNAPALRLYERLGFRTEFIYEEARFGPLA